MVSKKSKNKPIAIIVPKIDNETKKRKRNKKKNKVQKTKVLNISNIVSKKNEINIPTATPSPLREGKLEKKGKKVKKI